MRQVGSTPPPQEPDEGRDGVERSPWVAPGTSPGWDPAPRGPSPPEGQAAPGWQAPPGWETAPGWQAPPAGQAAPGWGAPGYQPTVQLPKAGSVRTGPLPLHPMSFGDLLDGAFRLLKANLSTIVLISALFFVPLDLISAFLTRDLLGGRSFLDLLNDPSLLDQQANVGFSTPELVVTGVTSLLGLVVTPLVGGAITRVVAASYLGNTLSAGEAIRTTGRRVWALLGATICVHLAEGIGLLLCILPSLVAMAFFVCTTPAVMLEGLGPIKGMRRSFALVRPRFWPVLGIAVVSGLMTSFLTNILGFPFAVAGELIGLHWGFILLAIGNILPALVASPFVAIVATLVYFDGRIRHEGFDLQMIAGSLSHGAAPAG
jgi:ABC-type sugar transport system permease subunit